MMSELLQGKPQEIPFQFTGNTSEYFGIWIVNLLLTILTFGIYSAWAKVRTRRYFYSNTLLEGSPFDYLASPIAILKGWLVALMVLIAYSFITSLIPIAEIILFPLLLIAIPWMIVRSMRFHTRNSAWRNIRFGFKRSYGEAARIFILYMLLTVLTLGLFIPYYYYAINCFYINNSGYGTTAFRFYGKASDFYQIFTRPVLYVSFVLVVIIAFSYIKWDELRELMATLPDFESEESMATNVAILMGIIISLLYFVFMVYIQSCITNLVYNSTELAGHRFRSSLKAGDLLWLHFSNLLAILFTFGLMIPWTKIRMARYRASKLVLLPAGNLDVFMQAQQEKINAMGEELGEVFDLDIGI